VLAESSISSAASLLLGLMTDVHGGVVTYGAPITTTRLLSPAARAACDAAYSSAKAERRTLCRLAQSAARARLPTAPSGQHWIR
jgi:hypothetical protein